MESRRLEREEEQKAHKKKHVPEENYDERKQKEEPRSQRHKTGQTNEDEWECKEEAERHLRKAAELEPWSAQAWLRLAALLARRDAAAEREALREVLHRVPHHAGARARLDELRAGSSRRGGRRSRH